MQRPMDYKFGLLVGRLDIEELLLQFRCLCVWLYIWLSCGFDSYWLIDLPATSSKQQEIQFRGGSDCIMQCNMQ